MIRKLKTYEQLLGLFSSPPAEIIERRKEGQVSMLITGDA